MSKILVGGGHTRSKITATQHTLHTAFFYHSQALIKHTLNSKQEKKGGGRILKPAHLIFLGTGYSHIHSHI